LQPTDRPSHLTLGGRARQQTPDAAKHL